jgi:DtxR family transcriptional regulator, Mn-dependent transcriptional regulator
MNFSIAEENYIKGIYHLQQLHAVATTNLLADELQTKPASVTDMLQKLQSKKILEYKKYKGFRLNSTGNKIALNIIRRHRLWEFFLVNKLGFDWDAVHPIAEELEHVSSPDLIRRLDIFLQFPQTDPHGDPIPDTNGKIVSIKQICLSEVVGKKSVTVSSVSNQTPKMLEMLKHYNIKIGTQLKINKRFDFDGSMEIKIAKHSNCIVSGEVAKNLFVYNGE